LTLFAETVAIQPASIVRDLGVLLDSELGMRLHIAKVATDCFFQMRRLRQLCQRIGQDVMMRLVLAIVMPRLDYCNSEPAGLPALAQSAFQLAQNAAARVIFHLKPSDHFTASFLQLHLLSVHYRITYKLCTVMYASHQN
jgi:hypothetical protein